MASSIPLQDYGTPNQPAADTPTAEDRDASSAAIAKAGANNTLVTDGHLPATSNDDGPVHDAAHMPEQPAPAADKKAPKPFWKKNSFWNKVLTPTNTLLTVVNFAPTFMARTVDDRRLALDYSKARGEQWSRDIVFRQQCEKDRVSALFCVLLVG